MKYLIKESQIDDIIRKYLDDNYEPDYGWAEPIDYKDEYDQWDEIYFEINDVSRYQYVDGKLVIDHSPDLDGYFGNMWKEIFRTWFEEHTGLRVYEFKVLDW
jgi:hypothetical protein